jgi:hypothetical protein
MKIIQGVDVKMIAQMVEERIDTLDTHITWSSIAKELKMTPSAISHFRKKGTELGFGALLKLCKLVFPKNYIDILADWSLNLNKPSNIKYALEFLAANRKIEHIKIFYNNSSRYPSKQIKELIYAYFLLTNHLVSFLNSEDLFNIVNLKKKAKLDETLFILEISEAYYYNSINNIDKVAQSLDSLKKILNRIADPLLSKLYTYRVTELESIVLLFNKSETTESRLLSEKIIKSECGFYCASFFADAYYRIGMSFLFESPDMCLANLKKAKEYYLKDKKAKAANNLERNEIAFAKIYWGIDTKEGFELEDSYKTFQLIRKGENEQACALVSELDSKSPFTLYYKGLATGDVTALLESLVTFKNKGNYFYAQLPKRALESNTETKNLVKLILS